MDFDIIDTIVDGADIGAGAGGDGAGSTPPPTGGQPGGATPPGATTPPAAGATATPPSGAATPSPERTFTQKDIDRIVTDRLARERRSLETDFNTRLLQAQDAWEAEQRRIAQQGQTYQPPRDPIREALTPVQREVSRIKLDGMIRDFSAKHPDFAANERAILSLALQLGTDNLDLAYRYWKADQPVDWTANLPADVKKQIEDAAVARYMAEKRADAGGAPRPEGKGGTPPTTPGRKIKTLDDADRAAKQRLERAAEHGG